MDVMDGCEGEMKLHMGSSRERLWSLRKFSLTVTLGRGKDSDEPVPVLETLTV